MNLILHLVDLETINVVSYPIIIDRTPPTKGTLNDGSTLGKDINYQSNTTSICINWQGISDPHSGISLYQWGVGYIPLNYSVLSLQNLTDEEIQNHVACRDVLLITGDTYYSTLQVVNGAEEPLTGIIQSNGGKYLTCNLNGMFFLNISWPYDFFPSIIIYIKNIPLPISQPQS